MQLDESQRRAFIALTCKVAWADGVVTDEERAQVASLVERVGGGAVSAQELDEWLATGAPATEITDLSPALCELFVYEAFRLIEADGDVAVEELKLLERLVSRVGKPHHRTPLGRVAIAKRPAKLGR